MKLIIITNYDNENDDIDNIDVDLNNNDGGS